MEKRVTGERNSRNIAKYINTLGRFCGKRDVDELTQKSLYQKYGFHQADLMVLFGGSILCGGDVLAQAMANQVAKKYVKTCTLPFPLWTPRGKRRPKSFPNI